MDFPDAIADPRFPRRLSRAEWDRMVAAGELDRERVELIRGVVVRMSPLSRLHTLVHAWLTTKLVLAAGMTYQVMPGGALAAADESEPETDVMVCPADWTVGEHPSNALLVIEVSAPSLRLDLGTKLELYAETGVPEYWLVDAEQRVVHVHTEPDREPRRYARVAVLRDGDVLRPTLIEGVALAVADLPH